MSTEHNPLSDDAFTQWSGSYGDDWPSLSEAWQECARRSDIKTSILQAELDGADKVIANLKAENAELGAEIERLRELFVKYTAHQYKKHNPEGLQCTCRMCGDIKEARAALDGKSIDSPGQS
jgi:hypothetical protein